MSIEWYCHCQLGTVSFKRDPGERYPTTGYSSMSIEQRNAGDPEVYHATDPYSEDGVDLTLIRWMLRKTPEERLKVLQNSVRAIVRLRNARVRS